MARARDTMMQFKGPPHGLAAVSPVTLERTRAPRPQIELGGTRHTLHFAPGDASGRALWFRLPADTPPGTEKATVHVAGKDYPAVVEVCAHGAAAVHPAALRLQGAPGGELRAELEVTNAGNVPLQWPAQQQVRLRRAGALAEGVQRAFKTHDGDLIERLVALGAHLQNEELATAACAVEAADAVLAAGASCTVQLRCRVPGDLDPAVVWTGRLALLGRAVDLTLALSERASAR